MAEPPKAVVLADQLTATKQALSQFDDVAATLRSLADENSALQDQANALLKVLDAVAKEAESLGTVSAEIATRAQAMALACRNDGEARSALIKSVRQRE